MKKNRLSIVLLSVMMVLLALSACTGNKDNGPVYEIEGKTYYNTVDEYDNDEHSNIWFGKDGSFVMKDNFYDGYYEIMGNWSISENVITLDVKQTGVGQFTKIIFEIQDNDTLILRTTLAGSKSDHVFSTSKTSNQSGNSGSDSKFTYASYYNVSQTSKEKSSVEIRSDKSFTFIDKNDFGIMEYNGTYTQEKDLLTLTSTDGSNKTIQMLIVDEKNMILQSDVGVSATGDKFSTDYKPESSSATVPCTAISSLYNNYWAVEGVSNYDLEVKLTPADTTDTLTFSSEDEKVVKVNEKGLCTAVAPGTTKIHIKCGSIERVVGFETRAKSVAVSSVKIDPNKISILMNNTGNVKAVVSPDNATNKAVTYSIEDKSIASVDSNGTITGILPGNTKVIATANNGVSGSGEVCIEGETVIFKMENNVSVKASSGEKIPYEAYLISCWDGSYNKQDVTKEVQFHTAYTSALDIDGNGNVYAKGAIYETVDITVYFTFTDGSSLNVRSQDFIVHVEK